MKYVLMIIQLGCFQGLFSQGHHIEVTLENLTGDTVYLAYHYGNKQFVRDTFQVGQTGQVSIEGPELLNGGVYLMVMPDMRYFEFLVGDQQKFSIEADVNDFLGSLRFHNSQQNTVFLNYQKSLRAHNARMSALQSKQKELIMNPDSVMIIQEQIEYQNSEFQEYLDSIHAAHPGSFISDLIHAMSPPKTPEFEIDPGRANPDSIKMVLTYGYLRDHYFDQTNFDNPKLIRTPILYNKLNNYFNRILIQEPDSIIPQVDEVVDRASGQPEMFQYVVVFLLNNFLESNIMGLDAVFVDIAEKYYLSGKAEWADSTYIARLKDRVLKIKPNLIGQKAADLKMETISGEWVSLHEIGAEYTILYFWEPNCGFCKEASPRLYRLYQKYRDRGLEVFAVDTQANRDEWENYINENGYDWINAWDPDQQTYFRFYYDIYSTPTLYLLDADKTIIAKRVDVDALEQMLDQLLGGNGNMN
jgi:thiol-disulfide isomerase/thioredoxin